VSDHACLRYHCTIVKSSALVLGILFSALWLVGCDSGNREVTNPEPSATKPEASPGAVAPGSNEGAAPMSAGGAANAGVRPEKVPNAKDAQTAYDAAKKAYDATKNDKTKKAYVTAAMDLANYHMYDNPDQKSKYRMALQYYREVVKTDPSQTLAQANIDLIISIYKGMGRPVPGGE
jgi:hypothetical protein